MDLPTVVSCQGARLLCVDDEPLVRRALQRILCRAGFVVDLAANDTEARYFAGSQAYDALLLDFLLDETNGLDLSRELALVQPNAALLMVSGHFPRDRRVKINERVVHMVSKPWTPKALLETLDRAIIDSRTQ